MAKTVMIVEDNELNMKLFNDLLRANGYSTMPMRNGYDALDALQEHRPDLIIMDIQLPEISGLEVTKRIKQDDKLRSIPVIAVTDEQLTPGERERLEGQVRQIVQADDVSTEELVAELRRIAASARAKRALPLAQPESSHA